jgi:translation elongation factor EF-1alpha
MESNVVFFGPADHGKSTVIGCMFANDLKIDLNKHERDLRDRLGNKFKHDYLYSSLINPELASAQISRFSTRINNMKRIIDFTFIDTPGHDDYLDQREQGISMGKIGVFCLAINEVLNNKYEEPMREFTDLWFEHYASKRLICLLTKFDLEAYSRDAYEEAGNKVMMSCRKIHAEYNDVTLGGDIPIDVSLPGFAAIIPVAVEFEKRESINISIRSDKTPWYKGQILIDAIRNRANVLAHE